MTDTMMKRERVICTVEGGIPDRVPMDFGANAATLQKIYTYYGTNDHKALLEKLNIDVFDMRGIADPIYKGPVLNGVVDEKGVKQNFWGIRTRIMQTATGPEECHCDFPLKGVYDIDELERYRWPKADWFDYSDLKKRLSPWSKFAIMAAHGSFFQMPTFLKSLEDFLADIIVNVEAAEYIMDRFTEFYLGFYERMFHAASGLISIIRLAEDIGMQDRPLVSIEVFDNIIAPRLSRFIDLAHSNNAKLMFHSCGSVTPFIDRLIELGVDILDPIQTKAKDMDAKLLKKRFGDRICLHGSIDTQYTLPMGSVKEVEKQVRDRIEILGQGGRFILAPCHVMQTDVPMENVDALYRSGFKYGFYNQ